MKNTSAEPRFRIWGVDDLVSEPVNLIDLAEQVKTRRVTPETWVYLESRERWVRAADLPQLKVFFSSKQPGKPEVIHRARDLGVTADVLRRIKILAQMDLSQLERFLEYIDLVSAEAGEVILRRGAQGEAMFLVLEGEARARIEIEGKESILSTLSAGDFFGEISLLDQGPRSADVIANEHSVLLKITTAAFEAMKLEAPDVALAFLFSVSRSVVIRMRMLTRKYKDSVHFSQLFAGE
jgi:hypothetical protein